MKWVPFAMERWQSTWEHRVDHNLSESGVEPLGLDDLLGEADLRDVLKTPMTYAETQGAEPLREVVAGFYPDCDPENVLLTTGTSEANFLTALATAERGAPFVAVLPNYMQVWGVARSLGASMVELGLREDLAWQLDPEEIRRALAGGPTAVALSNPNNPTGACLEGDGVSALLDGAEDAGSWVLSDEVYRGAERVGGPVETLWGRSDRVVVTSGLSKAFGLPGLRLGWVVGPEDFVEELWGLHDYTTIAISRLTEALAARVLPDGWERLHERARSLIRDNFPLLEAFVERNDLHWVPPRAGAIAFVRYPWDRPSEDLAERARHHGVLVVPGAHFHREGYLRLGYGMEPSALEAGLAGLEEVFPGP